MKGHMSEPTDNIIRIPKSLINCSLDDIKFIMNFKDNPWPNTVSGIIRRVKSINQSIINQTSIAPIFPAKPGSMVRQPNQCSTAKSRLPALA